MLQVRVNELRFDAAGGGGTVGCEAGDRGLGGEEESRAHAPDTAKGGLSHGDASLTPPRPGGRK